MTNWCQNLHRFMSDFPRFQNDCGPYHLHGLVVYHQFALRIIQSFWNKIPSHFWSITAQMSSGSDVLNDLNEPTGNSICSFVVFPWRPIWEASVLIISKALVSDLWSLNRENILEEYFLWFFPVPVHSPVCV